MEWSWPEHPFQRSDLMSLNTIRVSDLDSMSARRSTLRHIPPPPEVEGSKPRLFWKKYLRNGVQPEAIEGTTPRTLFPPVNRPVDLSLRTNDIEKAMATPSAHRNSKQKTNPVEPMYQLPAFTPPDEPQIYLRPSNYIADIEGTCSRSRGPLSGRRETFCLRTNDIQFATPRFRHIKVNKRPASPPARVLQPRNTNPLQPEYKVSMQPTGVILAQWTEEREPIICEPVTIGPIKGSTPRVIPQSNKPSSLCTSDILGATPRMLVGCLEARNIKTHNRQCVADIPGCQADTKKLSYRRRPKEG